MAAYRRVYDSCHLQADCQEPGSALLSQSGLGEFQSDVTFEMYGPFRRSLLTTPLIPGAGWGSCFKIMPNKHNGDEEAG